MKKLLGLLLLFPVLISRSQELYVYTEPASNMPAHSLSVKLTEHVVTSDDIYNRFSHRFMPQVMFGLSRKWMVHLGATFSNMHTARFGYESVNLYAKYRFLSHDEIHKHFRMAVFTDASVTRVPFHYDEISLMGDKSGVQLGVIATQLWNKFALSGTLAHTQVFDESRNSKTIYVPARGYQSMDYTLSAGYLLIPAQYTGYDQLNINLYTELLAEHNLDLNKYRIDLAPAVQFIFRSNSKLNLGYRFEVAGNLRRMATGSWLLSYERTFLNALRKTKKS
jgi:hypothetical protein